MPYLIERRQNWNRIIGVERRGAPVDSVFGRPLPDPTKLVDEDFPGVQSTPKEPPSSKPTERPLSFIRRRGKH